MGGQQGRAASVLEVQRAALDAVLKASAPALEDVSAREYFARQSRLAAELTQSEKSVFGVWDGVGSLSAAPGAHGIPDELLPLLVVPCVRGGHGFAERIVFHDETFLGGDYDRWDPEVADYLVVFDVLEVRNALGVAWKAGERPLGMLGVFGCRRPGGYTEHDIWMLRLVASITGGLFQAARSGLSRR